MHLALDIGNSAIKGGLFSCGELVRSFRIPHGEPPSCPAEQLLTEQIAGAGVTSAGLASVVPALTLPLVATVERLLGVQPRLVHAAMPLPFRLAYETPHTLGADRLAAAAAGWLLHGLAGAEPRSVVVVDAGTAVTCEVVECSGVYLGGTIAPGPALSLAALTRGTAQLPAVPFELPEQVVGRSTREAIQSGLVYGFLDGAAGMLARISSALPDEPVVVATGGWSPLLRERVPTVAQVDQHLVLRGIRLLTDESAGWR